MATFKPGPKALTLITPDLSRRARRELGLSQSEAIKASGIHAYRLKMWEGSGLALAASDLRKIGDFYESQGVNLAELAEHISQTQRAPATGSMGAPAPLQDGFTYTPRPGFMISDQLAPELVDKLMERMEANDDRIGELIAAAFKTGFFGDISDETEAKARELLAALAENHVIFRSLQGRNIIAPTRDEPKTLGNYLAQLMQESPVMPLIASADDSKSAKRGKASGSRAPAEAVE